MGADALKRKPWNLICSASVAGQHFELVVEHQEATLYVGLSTADFRC